MDSIAEHESMLACVMWLVRKLALQLCFRYVRNWPCLRTLFGVSYCILLRMEQGYGKFTAALIGVVIHNVGISMT